MTGRMFGAPLPADRLLPPDISGFTGRTGDLSQLAALLERVDAEPTAVVISAVNGTAGVGTTALAVHWAHEVRDRFPDGQLYLDLRGFDPSGPAIDATEALRCLLDMLGVPPQHIPTELAAQSAMFRSLLAGRRTLVLLDNAGHAEQVRPFLPVRAGCLVLVTSRDQLPGLAADDRVHSLTLDLLATAEAGNLLARRIGADRIAAEPYAAGDLIALCARLPLALAVVGAHAAARPQARLTALAGEIHQVRGGPAAPDAGGAANNVRAVFAWSYGSLSAAGARLFRMLGLHVGSDVSLPAAASLAGLPPAQAPATVAELAEAELVRQHRPGRVALHDLLRGYALELMMDSDTERRAALHRLLDHYVHTAHRAALRVRAHREPLALDPPLPGVTPEDVADEASALVWFAAELPVLLSAIESAATAGFDTHSWQLAWSLSDVLNRWGEWHLWATTQGSAVAAAQRLGDRRALAHGHDGLGRAYTRLGRHADAEAHLRTAVDLYRGLGDQSREAGTELHLGALYGRQGRHEEGILHERRALDLFAALGHQAGRADALNAIGWNRSQLGDHKRALNASQQALTLHLAVGNSLGAARTWDSVGHAQLHVGNVEQAIASYRNGLAEVRGAGDRFAEAVMLSHLGDAHLAAGQPIAAREVWGRAVAIFDELHHPGADQVRTKLYPTS